MGFNATVVVLVDRLDEIERDPEFGKKLAAAIRYRSLFPERIDRSTTPGYRPHGAEATGQTFVAEVHHADQFAVVAVGANEARNLGMAGSWRQTDDEIVKTLVKHRKAGYHLL